MTIKIISIFFKSINEADMTVMLESLQAHESKQVDFLQP